MIDGLDTNIEADANDKLAKEWEQACDDAKRSIAKLPLPGEAMRWLTGEEIAALYNARASYGCWRISENDAEIASLMRSLRLAGMVEIRGPFLTCFGMGVRREIRRRAQ